MDEEWVTFKFWPKEKDMCQTTECTEARKLKKHNEELIAYSENMQSKLDDERDKSQKLQKEVEFQSSCREHWVKQHGELYTKYNDTSRELTKALNAIEALKDDMTTLRADKLYAKTESDRRISELKEEVILHSNRVGEYADRNLRLQGEITALQAQNNRNPLSLLAENERFKKTVEALTEDLAKADRAKDNLEYRLNVQAKNLQDYQMVLKKIQDIAENEPV